MKFTPGVRKIVQLEIVTALTNYATGILKAICQNALTDRFFFEFWLHHITTVLLLIIIDRARLAGVCFSARPAEERDEVDYEACQLITSIFNCAGGLQNK
jgi:hypothetical protein